MIRREYAFDDTLEFRRLETADLGLVAEFYLSLDQQARIDRFGGTHVSDLFIREYIKLIDCATCVIDGCLSDGVLRGCFELRALTPNWGGSCELYITVAPAFRRRKMGMHLLKLALDIARQHHVLAIYMPINITSIEARSFLRQVERGQRLGQFSAIGYMDLLPLDLLDAADMGTQALEAAHEHPLVAIRIELSYADFDESRAVG